MYKRQELRNLARELSYLREQSAAGTARGRASTGGGNGADAVGQAELNDIAERTRELGSGLLEQGVAAGDVESVLAQIEALAQQQDNAAIPAATAQYEVALRALMELEYRLRNQFDETEFPQLLISEPTELPDEYREMVADYFRKLSEQ